MADDLTAVKMHELLEREGVGVPLRTVQRYVAESCGRTLGQGPTVRVADGEPGDECQVDFGRMELVFDPATGRHRVTHALIFTACYSRHPVRVADPTPDARGGHRGLGDTARASPRLASVAGATRMPFVPAPDGIPGIPGTPARPPRCRLHDRPGGPA